MSYLKIMQKFGRSFGKGTDSGITRREFIKITGVSGLAIGGVPLIARGGEKGSVSEVSKPLGATQQPSGFLHIAPDGTVTVQINRLEFGQGSHTGLARALAEELDADWDRVDAKLAKAGEAFKDPLYGIQMTGGSTAIAHSFTQYRELGARARIMLVEATARTWGVDASAVSTDTGFLYGRRGKK